MVSCIACPGIAIILWIFSFQGQVVIWSFVLMAGQFLAAYVLRMIAFPVVNEFSGNWLVSLFFKNQVSELITIIKYTFYICLGYCCIGACGFLGALFQIVWMLVIYLIYLVITFCGSAYKVYEVVKKLLGWTNDIEKACGIIGGCSGMTDKLRKYTYWGAGIALLIYSWTAISCAVLIYRARKQHREDDGGTDDENNIGVPRVRIRAYEGRTIDVFKDSLTNKPKNLTDEEEEIPLQPILGTGWKQARRSEEFSTSSDFDALSSDEPDNIQREGSARSTRSTRNASNSVALSSNNDDSSSITESDSEDYLQPQGPFKPRTRIHP